MVLSEALFFLLLAQFKVNIWASFFIGVALLLMTYVPYRLNKEQILLKITGVSSEWFHRMIDEYVNLCPSCGAPMAVSQEVDFTTKIASLHISCRLCEYSSDKDVDISLP